MVLTGKAVSADEAGVRADVEVNDGSSEACGEDVINWRNAVLPRLALGEPDRFGTLLYRNGWLEIQLDREIEDCTELTVWVGNLGWRDSRLKVYTSDDGRKWCYAAQITLDESSVTEYCINGNYGDVRYMKISRTGSRWSIGVLDAVMAKGGDTQTREDGTYPREGK